MVAKTHEIAFEIAGKMKGDFAKTFQKASQSVKGFNGYLNNLNTQAASMDKLVRLRTETEATRKTFLKSQRQLKGMEQALASAKNPTKELQSAIEKQRQATEKARVAYEKKQQTLKNYEATTGTAGIGIQKLKQRQEELRQSAEKAALAQEKLAKATELQSKFKTMAKNSAVALAGVAATTAALGTTVKSAMNFEDMQAELGKYSDEAKEIFTGITNLTKNYSKSAQDMTDMAANAMQAGIAKTKDEVLTLIESQTQAAVAFGMTGDAVGEAWAGIQSKMGTSVKETQAVFDIVNKLGNETSASSEDILEVLQRQGGTLKSLTAMNEKQVAAMAGAFRSASVSSEVAATSMGTFISRLTVGEAATKKQQDAFKTLGLDAEDVAKKMTTSSESAEKTIQDVFSRINKLSKDKQAGLIGNLFGNEAGIKAAVATLSANANILGDNLEMVGDKTNYAGSMFKEYMARANTTSEAMGIARNQITLISASIGQSLLPAVKSATQSFIEIAGKVATFIQNNQQLVVKILKVTGVVVGLVATFHTLRLAFALTAQPVLALYKAFIYVQSGALKAKVAMIANKAAVVAHKVATLASKAAMLAWAGICKVVTAAQWLWNAALNANPIGLVIIAIAALIAAGIALYKNWDKVKAGAIALWNGIKTAWTGLKNATSVAWNAISSSCTKAWNKFKGFGSYIWGGFKSGIISAFQSIRNKISSIFSGLVGIVKTPINAIIGLVNKAIGGINRVSVDIPDWVPVVGGKHIGFNIPKIPQLAEGGIATKPTMAMIGEGRENEAVLPLSKLKGMLGGAGGGGISINFAPTINISGGSTDAYADVKRGLEEGQKNLKRELEKLMANQRRLSYT